jgi:hypothetical protein
MIDFFNINVLGVEPKTWEQHPTLKGLFWGRHNKESGEAAPSEKGEYKGLSFAITKNTPKGQTPTMRLKGSLGTYYNNGKPIARTLTIDELRTTIDNLGEEFEIMPTLATLRSIELSIDIELPTTVKHFLNHVVGTFTRNKHEERFNEKGYHGFSFDKTQYRQKGYDRGLHLDLDTNKLLRFEVPVTRMQFLNDCEIRVLSDLCDHEKLAKVVTILLEKATDLIVIDTWNFDEYPLKLRERIKSWINPLYWTQLVRNRNKKKRAFWKA